MKDIFEIPKYQVYIQTDEDGNVIGINSSAFLENTDGWIQVDEGEGHKYHHAQGNYLSKGLTDEYGRFNYQYVNGELIVIPEVNKPPISTKFQPRIEERIEAIEAAMLEVILGG